MTNIYFRYRSVVAIISCTILFLTGCKKFVEISPPANLITDDKVFADNNTATLAMKGVYDNVEKSFGLLNGQVTKLGSLYSNEIQRTAVFAPDAVFWSNSLSSNDGTLPGIWSTTYTYLHHVNQIIEKLPLSTGVTDSVRRQLIAEAKFMRALFYFCTVNCFGAVPLVVTTSYEENAYKARSTEPEIYQQVIDDLTAAELNLPENYKASSQFPSVRLRPNKMAAAALLARVYLYRSDWYNAELKAGEVINSGQYRLENDLNDVFLPASGEVILHFMPAHSVFNTAEGSFFVPGPFATKPTYVLATSLINNFEAGDLRKANWAKQIALNGQPAWYPFKYKVYQNPPPYLEYNVVLRLGEQFLIRAEAAARQNKVAAAIADLNIIRNRANLPNLPALDQTAVLAAIEQERQVELFAEWGHRWFDLRRWPSLNEPTNPLLKRADDILSVLRNGSWQAYKKLWPIPDIEIQKNKNLIQNEGY